MEPEIFRAVPECEDATQSLHPIRVGKKTLDPFRVQSCGYNHYAEVVDIAYSIQQWTKYLQSRTPIRLCFLSRYEITCHLK